MQCQACGRQFETYNKICPYCRTRNPETPQQPIANDTPDRQSSPSISSATSRPEERPRPKVFIPTDRLDESPDLAVPTPRPGSTGGRSPPQRPSTARALKGVFACVLFLLVVLVGWAALSSVPGLLPVTLTIGTHPAPDTLPPTLAAGTTKPTIATRAPTQPADARSPYSAGPRSAVTPSPRPTRYDAPGYRATTGAPAPAATTAGPGAGSIVEWASPHPIPAILNQSWNNDDVRYVSFFNGYLSTIKDRTQEILGSSLGGDWQGIRNGSEQLKRTTEEGISNIVPLTVSPSLSDMKDRFLRIMDHLATGSDRFIAAADAHGRGDDLAAGSLIVTGSGDIIQTTDELARLGEYLPKELAAPT